MQAKLIFFFSVLFFAFSSLAYLDAGIYNNGVHVNSAELAEQLFIDVERYGSDANVCYEADYEVALQAFDSDAGGNITINVLDVYGESSYPMLDAEIVNSKTKSSVGFLLGSCN